MRFFTILAVLVFFKVTSASPRCDSFPMSLFTGVWKTAGLIEIEVQEGHTSGGSLSQIDPSDGTTGRPINRWIDIGRMRDRFTHGLLFSSQIFHQQNEAFHLPCLKDSPTAILYE